MRGRARPVPRGRPVEGHAPSPLGVSRVALDPHVPTCRRHYPGGPLGSDRSWDGLFHPFPHSSPATAAFPMLVRGRRPHWTFRGLLNVHSRYGLSARCIAKATHLSRRLRRFRYLHRHSDSYRLERPSCRVGIAPTVDQHLTTAHTRSDSRGSQGLTAPRPLGHDRRIASLTPR